VVPWWAEGFDLLFAVIAALETGALLFASVWA
jgi:hypothetical protein